MQTASVKNIDNNHKAWQNALGFYSDELAIFKKRLDEVAATNTGREVMQMMEHSQNQFLIQAENIGTLQHDIHRHVSELAKEVVQHAGYIDKEQIPAHFILQERVEKETAIFTDLKEEFMKWLSKVM